MCDFQRCSLTYLKIQIYSFCLRALFDFLRGGGISSGIVTSFGSTSDPSLGSGTVTAGEDGMASGIVTDCEEGGVPACLPVSASGTPGTSGTSGTSA